MPKKKFLSPRLPALDNRYPDKHAIRISGSVTNETQGYTGSLEIGVEVEMLLLGTFEAANFKEDKDGDLVLVHQFKVAEIADMPGGADDAQGLLLED